MSERRLRRVNGAVTNTGHDDGVGGLYPDVVDTVFDVDTSLSCWAVRCDVLSRLGSSPVRALDLATAAALIMRPWVDLHH